ncbi:helix-turn-helix domain-containing protein [Leifsonia sp. C5G2]|uniref:helix-turn-helix domain-containing protein n=1 Tax=Leifsonia sp. C5G2 TaxID=2735269 RepID=UPI001584D08C|nr:helix-turn-helix domain-containing protein [Leifsonia sp. C5G2]NUU07630.1 helix-turn-helix domain-containing protein [Leifsonia sp. C5G2]
MTLIDSRAVDAVDASERSQLEGLVAALRGSSGAIRLEAETVSVSLPADVANAVVELLGRLAHGDAVVIASTGTLLTTSQAADLLGVSRMFVVQLLDKGELEVHYRNTHRRVALADVLRYAEERRHSRREGLDRLSDLTEEAGGYEGDAF